MNIEKDIVQISSRISFGRSLKTLLASSRYAGLMFSFWCTSITDFFRKDRFPLGNFSYKFSGIFLLFNPLKPSFMSAKSILFSINNHFKLAIFFSSTCSYFTNPAHACISLLTICTWYLICIVALFLLFDCYSLFLICHYYKVDGAVIFCVFTK